MTLILPLRGGRLAPQHTDAPAHLQPLAVNVVFESNCWTMRLVSLRHALTPDRPNNTRAARTGTAALCPDDAVTLLAGPPKYLSQETKRQAVDKAQVSNAVLGFIERYRSEDILQEHM